MRGIIKGVLKNWLRYRDRWNTRIYNKYAIPFFEGMHPKNVFNYRYEFFVENINKEDIVLDIACGTGFMLNKIAPFIFKGYGIDISPSNIKLCKQKHYHDNLEYMEKDIFNIDYSELKKKLGFNIAILSAILEHIENVPKFLKNIEAETLLICVPSQENWEMQLKKYLGIRYLTDDTHFREYTREMLSKELETAGYSIEFIGFNPEGEIIAKAIKSSR